jgi:serine/threonine protein kinase
MEFIEYGDLNCYLNEHVRMPEYLTKEVTTQILRGIEYIHAMGISHRDLKPDNILIASDDPIVVKISDFGLAKMVSNEETFLKTFCGTMLYLAPEVFPGYAGALADGNLKRKRHPHDDDGRPTPKSKRRPYSQAVDMWSLGCVVFALLCGSPPFEGQNKDEMCQLVTKVPFDQQRLCKYVGQDNDHCVDFIGKLLQIYPERRMMEVEALRHPWLMTDTSSSSQGASELPDGISSSINLDEDELTTKNSCNIQPVARGDDNVNDDNNGSKSKESDDNMTTPKAKVDVVIDKDLNGSLAQLNVNQIFDVETSDNHDSSGTGDDGFESLVNSREEFTQGSTGLSVIDRARAHAKNPHASCQESLGVFPESGLDDKSGSDSVLVDKRCQANGVGKEPVCPLTGAESGIDNLNFKTITPSPPPAPSPSPPPPCSDVGVSKAPSTPPREGRQNPTESFDLVSFTSAAANFNFSPESLKHCSPTDTPVRVDPSRKLIARAIPTIAILRVPADDDLPSTQPVCSQPSAVTVSSNFRFPPTPWGKLAPLAGSILAEPVTLRGQIVSFGRATNCTIRPTDIRISKHHFALQIHHPDRNLQNDPTVSRLGEWYPEPNMVVSYQVLGRCGVYINGQRVESGSVGRIWDGDEILLFKDVNVTDDTVQFMGFRAELVIGDVKRDPSQSRTGPSIYVPFSSDRSRGVLMGSSNGGASTGNSMGTTGFHVPSGINSSRLLQPGFGRTRADMSSAGAGAGASTTTASMRV